MTVRLQASSSPVLSGMRTMDFVPSSTSFLPTYLPSYLPSLPFLPSFLPTFLHIPSFIHRCGKETIVLGIGAKRKCQDAACRTRCYPRTDPSGIAIVFHRKSGKALLARGKGWTEGFWSCVAGFAEICECVEDCIVREVKEETGVSVDRESVRIASTQAWPTSRTGTCVVIP